MKRCHYLVDTVQLAQTGFLVLNNTFNSGSFSPQNLLKNSDLTFAQVYMTVSPVSKIVCWCQRRWCHASATELSHKPGHSLPIYGAWQVTTVSHCD